MLGDVAAGRPNQGNTMSVSVYHLMQFTLHDVLIFFPQDIYSMIMPYAVLRWNPEVLKTKFTGFWMLLLRTLRLSRRPLDILNVIF